MAFFRLYKRLIQLLLVVCIIHAFSIWKNYYITREAYLAGMAEVKGWYRNKSRNTELYVHPNKDTTRILPKEFCQEDTLVLIIVCSYYGNFAQRVAIRESWGSLLSTFTAKVYFMLGESLNPAVQKKIVEESREYNDVIQEHFVDSYYNLTIKSLMMLKIVDLHCTLTTGFVMKVDDDVYVNVNSLVRALRNRQSKNLLLGHLFRNERVIRNLRSKWNAPYYLYGRSNYPDFLTGTGYLISIDVVPRLFAAALKTPIYHLEDVYITGILAKEILIKPTHSKHFFVSKQSFPCLIATGITAHGYKPKDLRLLYESNKKYDLPKFCELRLRPDESDQEFVTRCICSRIEVTFN